MAIGPWLAATRHPVCLHASIRESVISYLRTTLAVLIRLLARRLGTQTPISPIRPFLPHDFRRAGLSVRSSRTFRIGLATASTPSGLLSTATPRLALWRLRCWAATGGALLRHLRLSLLGWSTTTPRTLTVSRQQRHLGGG